MKNKWIVISCCLFLIAGCAKRNNENETKPKEEGIVVQSQTTDDYSLSFPYQTSPTRVYHGIYLGSLNANEIGKGLLDYSKKHFNVKDNYLREGQLISYNQLLTLTAREGEDNPQGLNPIKGSMFDIGDGQTVLDAVVVADVMELNFVSKENKNKLQGISLAIVMNQNQVVETNGVETTLTISDERLYEYGSDMGRRLERYLRTLADVDANLPIYITLYSTSSSDATLPGKFIGHGLFKGRSGQFDKLQEQWVLIPTDEALKLDSVTYSQFLLVKSALKEFIPENISLVGTALYQNNNIKSLKIDVNVQAKTYSEINALIQYLALLLDNFDNTDMEIKVVVQQLEDVQGVLQRKVGSMKVEVIEV